MLHCIGKMSIRHDAILDASKYVDKGCWYQDFWKKVAPQLAERSKKFVGKRVFSTQTHEKVVMVLYSEIGKLLGTVAKTSGYVFAEDAVQVRDAIAKGLACVTIVVARLAAIYGIDFQECFGIFIEFNPGLVNSL